MCVCVRVYVCFLSGVVSFVAALFRLLAVATATSRVGMRKMLTTGEIFGNNMAGVAKESNHPHVALRSQSSKVGTSPSPKSSTVNRNFVKLKLLKPSSVQAVNYRWKHTSIGRRLS